MEPSFEFLEKMPSGKRIEHLSQDKNIPEAEILDLFQAAFRGGGGSLLPVNERWILWSSDKLIGHAGVQRRWFVVKDKYFEGWLLGGICINPDFQGKGLANILIKKVLSDLAQKELDFAILCCDEEKLVSFYKRFGFIKISDSALYLENGKLEKVDGDRTMVISFAQGFDAEVLRTDPFPFGFDFCWGRG